MASVRLSTCSISETTQWILAEFCTGTLSQKLWDEINFASLRNTLAIINKPKAQIELHGFYKKSLSYTQRGLMLYKE
jgi:hypothetical protein